MVHRRLEVQICTVSSPGLPAEEKTEGYTVHRLTLNGSASLWEPLRGDIDSFRRIIREFTPDIVVLHGWQGWGVRLIPWLNATGIPVILQSHGFGMHRVPWNAKPPFGLRTWVGYQPFIWRLPSFVRKMHSLVVLSKEPNFLLSFDHWLPQKAACHNVVTIPNGVPQVDGDYQAFLEVCPQAVRKRLVLYVANYCDRKNQLLALDVCARIPVEDVLMVFIGGAPNDYSSELENEITKRKMENRAVVLCGINRNATEGAISACEVALMTSKWEMQPLFLLEAMSVAKPWVSTNVGSVKELKGGIISSNRANELASAVCALLTNPDLASRQGSDGVLQWRSDFAPEVVYDKWLSLLCQIRNSHAPSCPNSNEDPH